MYFQEFFSAFFIKKSFLIDIQNYYLKNWFFWSQYSFNFNIWKPMANDIVHDTGIQDSISGSLATLILQ